MIFYFSGTGNSLYAARKVAEEQEEKVISIASEYKNEDSVLEYLFKEDELLGFVFPIYCLGTAKDGA